MLLLDRPYSELVGFILFAMASTSVTYIPDMLAGDIYRRFKSAKSNVHLPIHPEGNEWL